MCYKLKNLTPHIKLCASFRKYFDSKKNIVILYGEYTEKIEKMWILRLNMRMHHTPID